MQSITSVIIDDEPKAIENLEILLSGVDHVQLLKSFTSGNIALEWNGYWKTAPI